MSKNSRKVGKMSNEELKFLKENNRKMSFEEMAAELNRSVEFCKNNIIKLGLHAEPTLAEEEDRARCIVALHSLGYWKALTLSYDIDELKYFEDNWYPIYKQLNEDVSYTEHLFIKDWLMLEMEKNRLLMRQKTDMDNIKRLRKEIKDDEDNKEDIMKISAKKVELQNCQSSLTNYASALEKFQKDIKIFSDKIKSNREQRRKVENSADTYWGYVQLLEDEEFRNKEARYAELHMLAYKKEEEKLSEWHEYADNTVDLPLLNHETYTEAIKNE